MCPVLLGRADLAEVAVQPGEPAVGSGLVVGLVQDSTARPKMRFSSATVTGAWVYWYH